MVTDKSKWTAIDARWKSGWKAHQKNQQRWFDVYDPERKRQLAYFASTGRDERETTGFDMSVYKGWEVLLSIQLDTYGLLKASELELRAVAERRFDYQAASSAYAAARVAQMIYLHIHIKSPERLGEQLSTMDWQALPLVALGVVIGDPSALPLARLLIAAARRGWYPDDARYPVYIFIMLLMAAFLEESLPQVSAGLPGDSPLAALLSEWRNPDPEVVQPLCLAACSFHTTRCREAEDVEFANGDWCYTPIEIMLLMRLRSLSGLPVVELEHPLWNRTFADAAIGSAPVVEDELIRRVEQRMSQDAYQEALIAGTMV